MLDEAGRLNVVAMRQHELLILRWCADKILAKLPPAQCPVDKCHGNGLSFLLSENKPVAPRELRRLTFRALELVYGFALGHFDLADSDGKSKLRNVNFNLDNSDPQLTDKGMVARIAPLRRIAQTKKKSFIAT